MLRAENAPAAQRVSEKQVREWLGEVLDPEIPVLSVTDLGIVRDVVVDGSSVLVEVAPTYSGCPATEVIEQSILTALRGHGVNVSLKRVLSPPWTTDWITDAGREKLLEYGIAPPLTGAGKREMLGALRSINCPRCASTNTQLVSEFGSTACKAAYKCEDCLEPFEYFKCL
jgi:ring-1,2-phenylacetyl-CoA epoxidase subunit PaaD